MRTINLDLSMRSIIPLLHAKQGDVGRKFKVILTDGGVAYPVPAGAAVSVWYSGASGEGNYTDIGAESAISVSGNEIIVELITQMLTNSGAGSVCLVINTADGDQLGMWNIPYMVEPLPGMGSAAAQAYFTAFSQAVENLPYPDATLSLTGKAADAAAVGAALDGKAPSGYGLGSYALSAIQDMDDTTILGGWYVVGDEAAHRPYRVSYGYAHIINYYNGEIVQLLYEITAGYNLIRRYVGGTWQPWEYVNPPMIIGEEYRTTERWNGKSVYTKAVNLGYLPVQGTTISVQYAPDVETALRACGYVVESNNTMPVDGIPLGLSIYASGDSIEVCNIGMIDLDDNTGVGQVWYTKKD